MLLRRIRKLFNPSDFHQIFYIEKKLMRLASIWPGDSLINFKFLSIYVSSFFLIFIPLCGYFATTDDKFHHIAIGIQELIQELVYISKMFNILLNRRELKELVATLENGFKALSENHREFHQKILRRSHSVILLYVLLVPAALVVHFYVPITIDIVNWLLGRHDVLKYPFVLKANYIVIDARKDNLTFMIYTIISRIYINFFLLGFYVMDLFLLMIFFYVSSYFESIKLKIKLLSQAEMEMSETEMTQSLVAIIEDHVLAISMVKSLDSVTRNVMITQFVLFSFSFCFILFNFTQIIDNYFLFAVCIAFVIVTQLEQFVFSYLGSKIQSEACSVGVEVYNLKWYNYSMEFQKMVSLIIARSQDVTVAITAGRFYSVNLESYGTVLRSSYGYFTLIHSLYSGNGL